MSDIVPILLLLLYIGQLLVTVLFLMHWRH